MNETDRWTVHLPTIVVIVLQVIAVVGIARFVAVADSAPASDQTAAVSTQSAHANDSELEPSPIATSEGKDANPPRVEPGQTHVDIVQARS